MASFCLFIVVLRGPRESTPLQRGVNPESTESAHAAKTNYGAWILRTAASLSVVAGQQAAELCAEQCAAGGTQLTTVAAAVTFCQCQQGALT